MLDDDEEGEGRIEIWACGTSGFIKCLDSRRGGEIAGVGDGKLIDAAGTPAFPPAALLALLAFDFVQDESS